MTKESTTAIPSNLRVIQHALFAACIVLAPLTLSMWFTLCPQYGNAACPSSSALPAFRAANPTLMGIFLTASAIVPYIYPLSYLGLGILAMKRSPWLATIGIILGWLGSIAWGFIAEQMFIGNDLANLGNDQIAGTILNAYSSTWQTYVVATGWVLGHLLAYVFLGVALLRAGVIPRWGIYPDYCQCPADGTYCIRDKQRMAPSRRFRTSSHRKHPCGNRDAKINEK